MIGNKKDLSEKDLNEALKIRNKIIDNIFNGCRIHYTNPTISYDANLGIDVVQIFNIKSRINYLDVLTLSSIAYDRKELPEEYRHKTLLDYVMDDCLSYIEEYSKANIKKSLTHYITEWPACNLEEWIEETFDEFWVTADFYKGDSSQEVFVPSDYAVLAKFFIPLKTRSKETFEYEYGQNFLLTKMNVSH